MLDGLRAHVVNGLHETLLERLRVEMEARQAETCAAEAELLLAEAEKPRLKTPSNSALFGAEPLRR